MVHFLNLISSIPPCSTERNEKDIVAISQRLQQVWPYSYLERRFKTYENKVESKFTIIVLKWHDVYYKLNSFLD